MSKVIELDWNPSDRILRQFGFIALFGFGALAAMAYYDALLFSFGLGAAKVPVAVGLLSLGLLSALLSLVTPRGNRPLYVGLSLLAYPIGFVMSYALMGALFFGLFAPIGLLFRALGRDSMHRSLERDTTSYWQKARPPRTREHYFRQF